MPSWGLLCLLAYEASDALDFRVGQRLVHRHLHRRHRLGRARPSAQAVRSRPEYAYGLGNRAVRFQQNVDELVWGSEFRRNQSFASQMFSRNYEAARPAVFLDNNKTIASCLNVVLRVAKAPPVYMAFKAASHI